MKVELERIERVKDEESKTFSRHNIHFNFDIIVRIKEAIVDVSSSCMELALKVKTLTFLSSVLVYNPKSKF